LNRDAALVFSDGVVKSIKKERGRKSDDKDALLGKYNNKLAKSVKISPETRTAIKRNSV